MDSNYHISIVTAVRAAFRIWINSAYDVPLVLAIYFSFLVRSRVNRANENYEYMWDEDDHWMM